MKINEVLTEGPLDFARKIGAKIKGAAANYQSASQQKDQEIKVNNIVKGALQKWNAVQANFKSAGKDVTPEVFLQWYSKFSGGQETTSTPSSTSPSDIKQWLTKQIADYLATKDLTVDEPETQPAQPKDLPPTTPGETPGIIIPPGARTAGPATTATATAQAPTALTPQERFQKVQNEPIVMKYKNFEFGLNDNGQWSRLGSNKALPQNYQAMLDQAAGYI